MTTEDDTQQQQITTQNNAQQTATQNDAQQTTTQNNAQQTATQNDAQQTATQINPPPSTELIPLDRNLLVLERKDAGESVIIEIQEKEPIKLILKKAERKTGGQI